ncbi:outer membrane porin GjpA [Mycolicibacterium sp.]|uniref:outer membrane porin GjpA n=1 Tax=Mycolicibacterium sp. TaxID=2320850 RepID=UPI0028A70C61|nr:outer membrane porin GjpA [Mycolicibacterium sp.]
MIVSIRSYLTAGVAAVGAGAMALTPIQALPAQSTVASERVISTMAVQLASTIDPITPWVNTLTTTGENVTALIDYYIQQPIPLAQTIWYNLGVYMDEDSSTVNDQIMENLNTFFYAPWSPGTCTQFCPDPDAEALKPPIYAGDYVSDVPITNPVIFGQPVSQRTLFTLLPLVVGGEDAAGWADPIASLVNFTATPYSGQLVGLLGPLVAPLISISQSLKAASEFSMDGDSIGALNEIINIPANMANAVLNGPGYLDLTDIAEGLLPDAIKTIGLNLGGLVSPPVAFEGESLDKVTAVNGGVMFDALAFEAETDALGPLVTVKSPGQPVSWFGAAIGLGQLLGEQMQVTPVYPVEPTAAVAPAAAVSEPADDPVELDIPAEDPAPVEEAPATGGDSAGAEAGDSGDNGNSGGGNTRSARSARG